MSASFHASRLNLGRVRAYAGDCGCGCAGMGCDEYGRSHLSRVEGGAYAYEYGNDYGSKYWLPGGMPDWNYDFWGRNKYRAGGCPAYDKAVADYQKAAREYDSLERNWFGNIKDDAKKKKIIQRAKEAQSRGKQEARNCKTAAKAATGKYADDTAAMQAGQMMQQSGGGGGMTSGGGQQEISDTSQQAPASGTSPLIYVGGGILALGGLALAMKMRKKKKSAPSVDAVASQLKPNRRRNGRR